MGGVHAGPESRVLEGVSWDEARQMQDAQPSSLGRFYKFTGLNTLYKPLVCSLAFMFSGQLVECIFRFKLMPFLLHLNEVIPQFDLVV